MLRAERKKQKNARKEAKNYFLYLFMVNRSRRCRRCCCCRCLRWESKHACVAFFINFNLQSTETCISFKHSRMPSYLTNLFKGRLSQHTKIKCKSKKILVAFFNIISMPSHALPRSWENNNLKIYGYIGGTKRGTHSAFCNEKEIFYLFISKRIS
jgi:hypothetical protein